MKKVPHFVHEKFSERGAWNFLWDDTSGLCQLADQEVCEQRHQYFALPDKNPEDYSERSINMGGGNFLIAGIRFKKLDTEFPYIEVHTNYSIENPKQIKDIGRAVCEVFSTFSPKGFTLFQNLAEDNIPPHDIWNQYVVGDLEEIKKLHLRNHRPELLIERSEDPIEYELYRGQFDKWANHNPELASYVSPKPKDNFYFSCQQGLYFLGKIDGEVCGFISAREDSYYGLQGAFIIEQLMFENVSEKKYSATLQWEFIQRLPKTLKIVWGAIHAPNLIGLETAQEVGRSVSEREFFFPF